MDKFNSRFLFSSARPSAQSIRDPLFGALINRCIFQRIMEGREEEREGRKREAAVAAANGFQTFQFAFAAVNESAAAAAIIIRVTHYA